MLNYWKSLPKWVVYYSIMNLDEDSQINIGRMAREVVGVGGSGGVQKREFQIQ